MREVRNGMIVVNAGVILKILLGVVPDEGSFRNELGGMNTQNQATCVYDGEFWENVGLK